MALGVFGLGGVAKYAKLVRLFSASHCSPTVGPGLQDAEFELLGGVVEQFEGACDVGVDGVGVGEVVGDVGYEHGDFLMSVVTGLSGWSTGRIAFAMMRW